MRITLLTGGLILLCATVSDLNGQQPGSRTYPEAAVERLRHLHGAWRMESDVIGQNGQVTRTVVVYDTLYWVVPDRVLGFRSHTPEANTVSTGLWFHDVAEDRFYLLSVNGQNGEFWSLSGTLNEWTITSEPKRRPNGSDMIIRFHHHDVTDDRFEATMEYSRDGGTTWTVGYRQRLTRLQ